MRPSLAAMRLVLSSILVGSLWAGTAAAQANTAEVPMRGQIELGPNGDLLDEQQEPGEEPPHLEQLTEGAVGFSLALTAETGAVGGGPSARLRIYSDEIDDSDVFWGLNLYAAWFPELSIAGGTISLEYRALDQPGHGDLSMEVSVGTSAGLFGAQEIREGVVLRNYTWGLLIANTLSVRLFLGDDTHRSPYLLFSYENGLLVAFLTRAELSPTFTPALRLGLGGYW